MRYWPQASLGSMSNMKKLWKDPALLAAIAVILAALLLFMVYPLFSLFKESLVVDGRLTLSVYLRALSSSSFLPALKNSLVLAVVVGLLSNLIGFIFAYTNVYYKTRFRKLFNFVSILPIISPPFVLSLSLIMLLGQRGLITYKLFGIRNANVYGFKGLVLVQVMTFFPVSYLMLKGLLQNIDVSLEEAAKNMGASRWKVFSTVTLPLMLPGIANGFLITFIEAIADFSNPMVIGGDYTTLATQIYLQAIGNYDMAVGSATAVTLMLISVSLFLVEKYILERKSYVTVSGKSARERQPISSLRAVLPAEIFCAAITVVVLGMYLFIPIGACFKLWGFDYSLTLKNFKYVLNLGLDPFANSLKFAAIAAPVTGMLAMVIAFLLIRKRFVGRKFMEFSSLLSMAVPGTVTGIGFVLAFNTKPFLFTGTSFILICVFVIRSLPVGVRSGVAALGQIDKSIEEAASDLGADSRKVFSTVTLPLIKPALLSGLTYSFVRSMTATSSVMFLKTAKHQLITPQIMNQVEGGHFGAAAAYSTILVILVCTALFSMEAVVKKMGGGKTMLDKGVSE